jgi:glycosyltransferase involved in cell wall biosynthesis
VRVLVWPTYSYAGNIGADSLYLLARDLIRAGQHGVSEPTVWELVVPDNRSVPVDDLDGMPNVRKIRVPMSVLYRVQEAIPDEGIINRFSPVVGVDPVDVLLSMNPARTLNVANAWSIRCPDTARPLLVNWDLLVRDDRAGEMRAGEAELVHQAAGYAVADVNVHESPIARSMALSVARKHLSSANVRRVIDTSLDVPQGIAVEHLTAATAGVPKREKFTVYYGGRFSSSKRLDELSEVIDAFYRYGRDVSFVVTTGSLDGQKKATFLKRYPQVELHVGLPQEEAWRVMASCHASICFSSHELFGMAFWEQMATGLTVIVKAERWNEALLPPGYPHVVSSSVEAGAQLRTAFDRWVDGRRGETDEYAEYVRKQYDAGVNTGRLVRHVDEQFRALCSGPAEARFDGGARSELGKLVAGVLDHAGDEVTVADLIDRIRGGSRVGRNVIGKRYLWAKSNATLDAVRLARRFGWEDALVDANGGLTAALRRSAQ